MKKIFVQLLLIFILFSNIFLSFSGLPSFVGYWDEVLEILTIGIGVLVFLKNKTTIRKNYFFMYLSIIIILILGIAGNIMFNYVSDYSNIFKDIVGFLKFPLTFIILKNINYDDKLATYITEGFIKFVKFLIIIIFMCGLISIFKDIGMSQNEIRAGIKPYMFLFTHPTYLVLSSLFMLVLIDSYSFKNDSNAIIYDIMLIIVILLTLRTKGVVIASLYLFVRYFGKIFRKYKILYYLSGGIIALTVASEKLLLYASYNSSPREALYRGSLTLIKKCFPFGSGFSSFASHISGVSNSLVYGFITIPYYWVENGNEMSVLGDAGFAYYIGQFGVFGFLLFGLLIFNIYKISIEKIENTLPVKIMWLYILVALTTESILINSGIELVFMLLLICGLNKKKTGVRNEKSFNNK